MQKPSFDQIPRELIAEIRAQNDIVEIISERVHLERSGKRYKARCPFPEHNDQNPSFFVDPDKQFCRCYGCNTGGDVISFLREYDGLTFWEAVKMLAERAGIPLPGQSRTARRTQSTISVFKELNAFALDFFHKQLFSSANSKALEYLKSRSVAPKTIAQFKLGYAPDGWNNFLRAGAREGFSQKVMLDGGFIREKNGSPYDFFRNRVMFPIFNEYGVPVAFSGRTLDDNDKSPKYMNSPETALYNKSRTLYNLHLARNAIQTSKQVILVEGYLDAIIPYQAGATNIAAVAGTSFTEDQAYLLKRYAEEAVIVFDADMAGINATLRSLNLLVQQGLKVKIVQLPPETADPDSFVREHGVDKFLSLVSTAIDLIDFQIRQASKDKSFRTIEAKVQATDDLCDTLSRVQNVVALNEYIKRAALELEIDEPILWHKLRERGISPRKSTGSVREKSPQESPRESMERQFLTLLIQHPDFIKRAKLQLGYKDFSTADYSQIARMLWQRNENEEDIEVQTLIDSCEDERLRGIISGMVLQSHNPPNLEANFTGCLKKLKDFILQDLEETTKKMAAGKGNDLAHAKELMELYQKRKEIRC